MKPILENVAISAGILLASLWLLDCTAATPRRTDARILVHEYQPPYTTTSCDKNGCSSTRHPARWLLHAEAEGMGTLAIPVRLTQYAAVKDGEQVAVRYRAGKLTGYAYWRGVEQVR